MENQKILKTPKKLLFRMQVVHLGKITFNLQFIVLAVMIASLVSFIMPALYYITLVCILILSFFSLLASPTFRSWWSGGETVTKIAEVLLQSWKYTIPIIAVLAIASIVCLCFDKNKKHIARIAVSAVICVLALIVLFFKLVNTGVI